MGSFGSGRTGGQPTAEACNSYILDVSLLNRARLQLGVHGTATLRFNDGFAVAVFARKDVSIQSNETTMSRGIGFYVPNTTNTTTTGMVGNVPVTGTSTTSGTSGGTYIPPAKSETIVLPPDAIQILLDLNKEQTLIVSGRRVEIVSASSSQISYRISPER